MATGMVEATVYKLLDDIISGEFTELKPLPAENELANRLGISRLTLREAIKFLSMGGVVNVVHGSGTYVMPRFRWRELSYLQYALSTEFSSLQLNQEIMSVHEMLEVGAARLAAENRSEEILLEMEEKITEFANAMKIHDAQAIVGLDNAFHDCISRASMNHFLPSVIHQFRDAILDEWFELYNYEYILAHTYHVHCEILKAIRDRNAADAAAHMHEHMRQCRAGLIANAMMETEAKKDV